MKLVKKKSWKNPPEDIPEENESKRIRESNYIQGTHILLVIGIPLSGQVLINKQIN